VQRANPDLTSRTSQRRPESCLRRGFKAARTANALALREACSGLTCMKSRVSRRAVGGLLVSFGAVIVGSWGGGVAAFCAYVGWASRARA
jgi:hypothetical protein